MQTDKKLSTVVTEEDRANGVKDEFGAIYSPDGKRLSRGVDSASYCIKPGTRVICDYAFDNTLWHLGSHEEESVIKNEGLYSITIPDSVTFFGDEMFDRCSHLVCITLSNSITHIGDRVFYKCSVLNKIYIPAGCYDKFNRLFPGLEDKFVELR